MRMGAAHLPPRVHMFVRDGLRLAFDAGSGTLLVLDEAGWAALGEMVEGSDPPEQGSRPEEGSPGVRRGPQALPEERGGQVLPRHVRAARRELEELTGRGLLFSPVPVPVPPRPVLKALCLHVAHACQMRCAYCFAAGGDYGGGTELMPPQVARAAVDMLLDPSSPVRRWAIDFFGGEPLLNWPVVVDTIEYARDRARGLGGEVQLTLTTNGLDLTATRLEFLSRERVNLVVSLDGRPEVHDAVRRLADGRPTWERALGGARRAASSYLPGALAASGAAGPSLWVRGTFTRRNPDFARDAIYLFELGFDHVSLEPVCGGPAGLVLGPGDLPVLAGQYGELARWCDHQAGKGRPVRFYHFELDPGGGPCLARRLAACGAGREYLAVTPGGELYACHQLVGVRDFLVGDVRRGITRPEVGDRMGEHDVAHMDSCRPCWARFLCGGGCRAAAFFEHRQLGRPPSLECVLQRIRWEWALWLRARRQGDPPGGVIRPGGLARAKGGGASGECIRWQGRKTSSGVEDYGVTSPGTRG